jgi:hypothetical protein
MEPTAFFSQKFDDIDPIISNPLFVMQHNSLPFLLFSLLSLFICMPAQAQSPGDTLVIQTFSYSDPPPASVYRGTFPFPDGSQSYQKILMSYSLKCDPSTRADNFDCGEWDYLTYTFLTDSGGVMDSSLRTQPSYNFIVGNAPSPYDASYAPTYTYYQEWQKSITYTNTLSLDSAKLIAGLAQNEDALRADRRQGRARFLWRESELSTAGLQAGDINGLQVQLDSLGSELRNLSIRIAHTSLDSLSLSSLSDTGFVQVYRRNTTFSQTGWHTLQFPTSFTWDGTSNLLIEFLYEGRENGQAQVLSSDSTSWSSGLQGAGNNSYLQFDGNDILNAGRSLQGQINGNKPRTIEAWAYTEAFNSAGIFQAGSTGSTDRDFSLRTLGSADRWRVQLWGPSDFDVTLNGSLNNWHHYAVTYDGSIVRLYYDGQQVAQRSASLNTGDVDFWIGRWSGSFFRGKIDEVRVWDKALGAGTLQAWKDRSLDSSHPDFASLLAYFPMDEGQGLTAADASGNGHGAALLGAPAWQNTLPDERAFNLQLTPLRPDLVLEQRTFVSATIDSVLSIDSVQNAPTQLVLYNNPSGEYIIRHDAPNQPNEPTDTLLTWAADIYSYVYDRASGQLVDSVFFAKDTTLIRETKRWYSNIVRYELARYITPYGINLDLGPEGKTWVYDVTDYAPLLRNSVYLQAGNNQELLDLKFLMIKGTPPREVKRIQNIYDGSWSFTAFANQSQAAPTTRRLDPDASMYGVKTRTTGHGFNGPAGTNCAEFCRRRHSIWVNGQQAYNWWLWNECSFNPVQPQGGTWVYDRAGWCPGDAVDTYDHEITNLVNPGDTIELDYEVDPGGQATEGNWVLRTQLVSYGPPSHQLDVAIEDIISPSLKDEHAHFNPICGTPVIVIRNRGAQPLTSALITYGVIDGFKPCYYRWQGNLGFMEEETITLPLFNWTGAHINAQPRFYASVSYPNAVQDEYEDNNYLEVPFELPELLPSKFTIALTTNRAAVENRWYITNDKNIVVAQKNSLSNLTPYRDPVDLPRGCYTFVLEDYGNDGLDFFANNDGTGSLRFEDPSGNIIRTFNPDFGGEVRLQFTVDYRLGEEFNDIPCENITSLEGEDSELGTIALYPNPTSDRVFLEVELAEKSELNISIFNLMGQEVWSKQYGKVENRRFELETPFPAGLYFVKIESPQGRVTKPLLLEK